MKNFLKKLFTKKTTTTFNLREDFALIEGPRFKSEGPKSAEELRDDYILPLTRYFDVVYIDLGSCRYAYPSYFLEELFGGMRRLGYSKEYINAHIVVIGSDKTEVMECYEYIDKED